MGMEKAAWEELPGWQRTILTLTTPQPGGMGIEDRPEWTQWTAAFGATAPAMLAGGAIGSLAGGIAGPLLAAIIGVEGMYRGMTGDYIPGVSDLLAPFNWPAEWTEQTIGLVEQANADGINAVLNNLPDAWQAGKLTYETSQTDVINWVAQMMGDDPAAANEVWKFSQGYIDPVPLLDRERTGIGPRSAAALEEARERVRGGEDMVMVYADFLDRFGDSGTFTDFAAQMVLDPLNAAPFLGSLLGEGMTKVIDKPRLAEKIRTGRGNPLIDFLPFGIQQGATMVGRLFPEGSHGRNFFRDTRGMIMTVKEYGDWVRTGYWPVDARPIDEGGNRYIPGLDKLTWFDRLVGGLDAEGMIKEHLGTHGVNVATIGVAGENGVRFACINADWSRNAGRAGLGAVMGSKNLKAIVTRGSRDLPAHDIRGLMGEADKAYTYMKDHKFFKLWQREGLMNVMEYANEKGILPTHNFKDATFSKIKQINGETMLDGYKIGDSACFACSMCCGNICLVKQGKYIGTVTEGPEYESCAMLGSNLGIDNFAAVLNANQLCDELGMDTISTGSLVGAVIEGYEKGIISLEDLDNKPITWGDEDAIFELVGKIAYRVGIGDIIAGGSYRIIEKWPRMSEVILQVKGLEQSAYDSRAGVSMALAYATSDIGAHHTRAWTIAREIEQGSDWSDEERVDLVIYHQTLRPLFDMLGVCRLPWIELGINEEHYPVFYRHVTGHQTSLEQLLEKSRGIYDLTRMINTRLGLDRSDDIMPYKVHANPIRTGPTAGNVIDSGHFEQLLDLYYKKRGWDNNGIPPEGTEKNFS